MITLSRTIIGVCCVLLGSAAFGANRGTWVEVRSPHFVVVSDAGDGQARKTAAQFEQIRNVFREYLTVAANHPSPIITIFAVKDEESLRNLLPEYWTPGHAHPGGIFFYRLNQFEAAVQLDMRGANPYEAIYHEYYHSLTVPYFPNLPLWLAEGLADFFGNTEVRGKEVHIGEPNTPLIYELQRMPLVPLATLFQADRRSPYYNEQNKTSIFYAESWALTHYLMLGGRESHKAMLDSYLTALQQGVAPDQAAARAFGDFGTLQGELQTYIHSAAFYEMHGPAPEKISDKDMTARELSEAEVDAYQGGFEALRGQLQNARPLVEDAIKLDPKLPLAWQNLGLVQLFSGARAAALASFSQSIQLDGSNGLTHYLRADLSLDGKLGTSDPQVEDDLKRAMAADPAFAPCYSLYATYLAAQNERLPEAIAMAQKAVSLEPGNPGPEMALATVFMQAHQLQAAMTAAQRARANALDGPEQENADQLLAHIEHLQNEAGENTRGAGKALPDSNPTSH